MNLGLAIKIARKAAGFNSKEFAEKSDLSASYLSLVEAGKREPSISAAAGIAKSLGIDISELFSIAEKIEKPANKAERLRNELADLVVLALQAKESDRPKRRAKS